MQKIVKLTNMTELIITTPRRLQMHEDQRVAKEFRSMQERHPGASASLIMKSIAASGKFKPKSFYGIRASLIRTGSYTPKTPKA